MKIYAASYLLPISSPPIAGGAIVVDNGLIRAVGPLKELRAAFDAPVTEFTGCTIIPGLVNAHTHLELTHFSAWKVRKDLDYLPKTYVEWIQQVVKIRRALQPGEVELSVREGLRLSLESGTTAVGEILTDFTLAPLYSISPLAGRIFFEVLGHDLHQCDAVIERVEKSALEMDGELLPGVSPHTPYTASACLFKGAQELSGRHGMRKAVHLSEPREEVLFMHDTTGPFAETLYPMAHWEEYLPHPRRTTSTRYLDSLGFLDAATLAIHAVHVTPDDVAILKERGVTVVLCPRSNDRLFVGTAPHHLFKKVGVPLAIGTDSLASNDSLSILDELRYLRQIAPGQFTADELLAMGTLGGAKALGIEQIAGSLESGKRGDFLVFSSGHATLADPAEVLLKHGKLDHVYVAGETYPPTN
ncbi:amidohydrolase family protein [Geomonas sp. Red32]|uniref:amidohydrolase family protein n=1 Tax=Geomonas sp. Red32 TaxID=2912856 RepID=UPI00202D0352|nr:amidohydrolase family protein [Geomonas sp. Red32]MCM0082227.1 amidohydrolase family protein [Geomonas sp. Red32]